MSTALIIKDGVSANLMAELLTNEGVRPLSAFRLHEILDDGKAVEADLVFVVSAADDYLSAGQAISLVRAKLGVGKEVVLCMRSPHRELRSELLKMKNGPDEIISPAGLSPEQIAERILGHIILRRRVLPYHCGEQMLGATSRMRELYELVEKYAPLDLAVLLRGETGAGKGLAAGELHRASGRTGNFVYLNCTTLNSGTVEDELFGHLRGAHSTAHSNRKGLVEEAHKGTLFLDEIGDIETSLQGKLLDVVENKRVRQLGSNIYRDVDVRFIFATNRDLETLLDEGKFRGDLFARMDVLPLTLPPLRQRKADIPLLVEYFIADLNKKYRWRVTAETGAVDELFRYDWPRNVRGLGDVVKRAAVLAGADGVINAFMLSAADRMPSERKAKDAGQTLRGEMIEIDPLHQSWPALLSKVRESYFRALAGVATNGDHAAELAKMVRSQVFKIFKEYGLHLGGKRLQQPPDEEGADDTRGSKG